MLSIVFIGSAIVGILGVVFVLAGLTFIPSFHIAISQRSSLCPGGAVRGKDKDKSVVDLHKGTFDLHDAGWYWVNPLCRQFVRLNMKGRWVRNIDTREIRLDWDKAPFRTKDGAEMEVDIVCFLTIVDLLVAARSCQCLGDTIREYVMTEVRNVVMELDSKQVIYERDAVETRVQQSLLGSGKGRINVSEVYGVTLRVRVQSVTPTEEFAKTLSANQQSLAKLRMQHELNQAKNAEAMQRMGMESEEDARRAEVEHRKAVAAMSAKEFDVDRTTALELRAQRTRHEEELRLAAEKYKMELDAEMAKKRALHEEELRMMAEKRRVETEAEGKRIEMEVVGLRRRRAVWQETYKAEADLVEHLRKSNVGESTLAILLRPDLEMRMVVPPLLPGGAPTLLSAN